MAPKVLHYMAAFSSPSQTFLYDLICALRDRGLESAVATRRRALEKERPFEPVFIVKSRNPIKRWLGQMRDPEHLELRNPAGIRKLVQRWQPNLLHAHTGMSGIRLSRAMDDQHINLPLIVSFHGSDVNANPTRIKGYRKQLEILLQRTNTLFITPSEFLRRRLIDRHGAVAQRCIVIPNAVHQSFVSEKKSHSRGDGTVTILCNGRLTEVKGHRYLLQAFAKVIQHGANARLVLVGKGELKAELQQQAQELGVAERVTFTDYIPHKALPSTLQQADIYVQPSVVSRKKEEESFGVAALEACAMGLPVIVSRCGGLPELLPKEEAMTVEPGNSDEIAAALMVLINDEPRRQAYAERCRLNALQHFTADKVYPRYLELYRKMLGEEAK